ncbi:MAG: Eco57I restriction-modification methylase domain-containing protein [Raineya sp.]
MIQTNYNPDVLTCLANLSNDEVFTPPNVVNNMLDLLPAELWSNPNATFLDPACKSGVFLREIAKRLIAGLEKKIPNKQKRINHIFSKQLYGIAITELTALLSRRSVYCSKTANGKYSICETFDNEQGNIRYQRLQHTWENGKCTQCGASQEVYDRGDEAESYAYNFIHLENPLEIFKEKNMKFDVIIGNPPYQLNDGGGTGSSAIPIYHKFIQQAKKLKPNYLSMIIPARWFTGGRGLDEFRDEMLKEKRISELHDFPNASDCFPGVEIKGGVVYFLWEKDFNGKTKVFTHSENDIISKSERFLLEKDAETFIRHNEIIPILHKVQKLKEKSFADIISANDPFGFDVRVEGSYKRVKPQYKKETFKDAVKFYYNGWQREGLGYMKEENIRKNIEMINGYKVLITKAWGVGDMSRDWLQPLLVEPKSCCTETYLVIGPFASKKKAENVIAYTQTKFFHLLVSLIKITQNAMKKVYSFVPMQDFNEVWTDEKLYKKYGLTKDEIAFIESMIRPMENSQNQDSQD